MLRFEKVATPFTAATALVPDRVPPLWFVPSAILIESVKLVTVLPASSCAATFTAGEIVAPAVVPVGWTVNASRVAGAGGGGGGRLRDRRVEPDHGGQPGAGRAR